MLPKTSNGASLVSFTVSVFETRGLALRIRLRPLIANPLYFDVEGNDARTLRATEMTVLWMSTGFVTVTLFEAA
jgi:hypothetical protein